MPLSNVMTVDVRPDSLRRYMALCHELAEHAKNRHDPLHWTAHETRLGQSNRMHFVVSAADFSEFSSLGAPMQMFQRVLGEQRAMEWFDEVGACTMSQREDLSIDRADLSYPPEKNDRSAPFAVVTTALARPGAQEACEELIRKLAEAIPKVDDPARIVTYQNLFGDLSQYWTVRPLESIADLDKQLPAAELLNQAFGPAEGGLIFRSGLEAMARVERSIVAYRAELSNPE